jgi:hypothetical protein
VRRLALLSLAAFVLACTNGPAGPGEPAATETTGACFGCECSPEIPCGAGLECLNDVCSLIEETGDESPPSACGWNAAEGWYDCGFVGADPNGEFPQACPDGLTADAPCPASLPFEGCCDAEGDVWYCEDGTVVTTSC